MWTRIEDTLFIAEYPAREFKKKCDIQDIKLHEMETRWTKDYQKDHQKDGPKLSSIFIEKHLKCLLRDKEKEVVLSTGLAKIWRSLSDERREISRFRNCSSFYY